MYETVPYGFWLTGLALIGLTVAGTILLLGYLIVMIKLGNWLIGRFVKD